jgi:error-prone DNA polymerase
LVELTDHHLPTDSTRNWILADLAASRVLPVVATNNLHYANPRDHQLAAALAAVRPAATWTPPAKSSTSTPKTPSPPTCRQTKS